MVERTRRLQAIFENATTPIWVKDLEGRYLEANQALAEPWGMIPDDLLGRRLDEIWPDEARTTTGLTENDREVLALGKPILFHECIEVQGVVQHFATIRFPLFDDQGLANAVCGIASNTTAIREEEAGRAASERLLQTMTQSSPDLFWVFDTDGKIIAELGNFEDVLGESKPEVVPTFNELKAWIHPEDLAGAEARFLQFIADGEHLLASRFRARGAGGTWVHLEARGRAMFDRDRMVGLVVTARNITQQVELEEELRHARDVADAANSAKSEFLSRISHELRTPLNSILGFSQLLEMEQLNELSRESVQLIKSAGEHLLSLVNEVLDLALSESGEIELRVDDLELSEFVARAIRMLEPAAASRGISLATMPPDDPDDASLTVRAHDGRLLQILVNLLANGITYNDPGGHVIAAWENLGKGRVRLEVSDDGWGLSPEDIEHVFEPLRRFPNPKQVTNGSGMGLAVVRQLTEKMGGTVGVRSALGRGSVFWIELPAA